MLIATADHAGMAHIAAAARVKLAGQNHIAVTEWFCLGTVGNLQENSKISVVMWDPKSGSGWQLLGKVEKVDDLSMLDGYELGLEDEHPIPQVQSRLLIQVQKLLAFRLAPHSDTEE